MTHSKPITTEAASLSSQALSSQGVTSKGKKGKQSLFSKLLANLGQGKQQQATNTSGKSKRQPVKVVSNPDTQRNQKTLTLTTPAPKSSKLLGSTKESNSDENRNSENIVTQNIQVMTSLQEPLTIQNLLQSKSNDLASILSTNTQVNLEFTSQNIQKLSMTIRDVFLEQKAVTGAISNINPENQIAQKQPTSITQQATSKGVQKVSTATHDVFLEQKTVTGAISNINLENQITQKQPISITQQVTSKGVQELSMSAREPLVEPQAMPQSIPKDIQKLGVLTNKILMKQTAAPNLISNTQKQTSERLQTSVLSSKEVPTNLMISTNQAKPTIQTVSQETLGLLQNKTTIATDKSELGLQSNNGIYLTPTKTVTRIRTTQSSDITDLESAAKEKIPVPTNKIEPQIEKSRGQSTTEPQLATLTKASMSKTQTNQSIDQTGIANISSTSLTKTTDVGNNTSQQDFSSDQQALSTLNLDGNKHENKLKGADFQAQLAYKSQRTFTPTDAMLEIVKSAKDGSTALELQLEPAHLGKVQVQIQMDAAKHIQVTFTVDQQTSKQALEQHMPQLRLALSQQGLDLGSFSMQMNQQQHQEHQSPQSAANDATLTKQNIEDQTQNNKIGINIATDGRLSILA